MSNFSFGQMKIMDTNPAGLKWSQINTPHFRLIFPRGFLENGKHVADLMETVYQPGAASLEHEPKKMTIIVHNQNSFSNGFVTLQPRRSEFFHVPPQDYNFGGTNSWYNLLAIHEYRHMVQFDKSLTGWNKFFYYIFGQSSQGLWSNLAVPRWFWEGDAVVMETALTQSGRGRIPEFDRLYKTNLLEYGGFKYNKEHLGSFKHLIPSHYRLGYLMTTYLRNEHGGNIWGDVTKKAWAVPFIPFTFSNALKKYTGEYLVPTHHDMQRDLKTLWENQIKDLETTEATVLMKKNKKAYTNYLYPQQLKNGDIIAMKNGIGDIGAFVKFDQNGNEHTVYTPGVINDIGMLSVENDVIAWNEFFFDPRWGAKNFAVIKLYDLSNGKLTVIGKKERYTAAALSPDAEKLITLEVTTENKYNLLVLEAKTGNVIRKLENPENYFYSMPRWTDDGQAIVTLKTTKEGREVVMIDPVTGVEKVIMKAGNENVGHPIVYKKWFIYNSPFNGIDNIYALNLETNERFQITNRKFGAYNPEVSNDGKTLFFNDFQKQGYDLVKMPFDPKVWTPIEKVTDRNIRFYDKIVEQENHPNLMDSLVAQNHSVTDYHRGQGFVNPYNWGPKFSSSVTEFRVGIEMQDVLSTVSSALGYEYNVNEKTGKAVAEFSYQGLYPIIDFGYSYGNRSTTENLRNDSTDVVEEINFKWKEQGLNLGLRFPFQLTKSKYITSLVLSTGIDFTWVRDYNQDFRFPDQQSNGLLQSLVHRVSFNRLFKRSQRDIKSKWGQTFALNLQHTPLGGDFKGAYLASELGLLFPGFFKHHSIETRGGYQYQQIPFENGSLQSDTYLFPSYFYFPRGYSARTFQKFYHFKLDYSLPLFYPDWSIGPIINIQRIKANMFYDYGYGTLEGNGDEFNSMGLELSGNFNFLRHDQLVDLGIRISYVPELKDTMVELLIANLGF